MSPSVCQIVVTATAISAQVGVLQDRRVGGEPEPREQADLRVHQRAEDHRRHRDRGGDGRREEGAVDRRCRGAAGARARRARARARCPTGTVRNANTTVVLQAVEERPSDVSTSRYWSKPTYVLRQAGERRGAEEAEVRVVDQADRTRRRRRSGATGPAAGSASPRSFDLVRRRHGGRASSGGPAVVEPPRSRLTVTRSSRRSPGRTRGAASGSATRRDAARRARAPARGPPGARSRAGRRRGGTRRGARGRATRPTRRPSPATPSVVAEAEVLGPHADHDLVDTAAASTACATRGGERHAAAGELDHQRLADPGDRARRPCSSAGCR